MAGHSDYVLASPVFIGAGDAPQMTVKNLGGNTVYYSNVQTVSSTTFTGSIAAGASTTVTAGQWFVTASGSSQVFVTPPVARDSDPFRIAGDITSSIPRSATENAAGAYIATGVLKMTALALKAGDVVTGLEYAFGAQAVSLTGRWVALFDSARVRLAVSADDATALATNQTFRMAFASGAYTIPTDGLYYAGIVEVAGTCSTMRGKPISPTLMAEAPALSGISTTGLTNAASCPNPAAAISSNAGLLWVSAYT
jgi:hypothetical protein